MSKTWQFAVIGGTGLGAMFAKSTRFERRNVVVDVSGVGKSKIHYAEVEDDENEFIFVDRHHAVGPGPEGDFRLPHELGHRLYMGLIAHLGVKIVLGISAVGGVSERTSAPAWIGTMVIPADFVDATHGVYTFAHSGFDHSDAFHRAQDRPFCNLGGAVSQRQNLVLGVGTRGPRFETRAEIAIYKGLGIDMVGMQTAVPEAVLAREASLHYALACVVTNSTTEPTSGVSVAQVMASAQPMLRSWIRNTMRLVSESDSSRWACPCAKVPSVFEVVPGLQLEYTPGQ